MDGSNELHTWQPYPHTAQEAREEAELRVAARVDGQPDDEAHQQALAAARRNVARFIGGLSPLATTAEVVSLPPLPDDPTAAA